MEFICWIGVRVSGMLDSVIWIKFFKNSHLYNISPFSFIGKMIFAEPETDILNRCNKITDRGLESLRQGLQSLTSLTDIFLFFTTSVNLFCSHKKIHRCSQITDASLNSLRQGFQSMTSLQSLKLWLGGSVDFIKPQ